MLSSAKKVWWMILHSPGSFLVKQSLFTALLEYIAMGNFTNLSKVWKSRKKRIVFSVLVEGCYIRCPTVIRNTTTGRATHPYYRFSL